ncbi:MAG: ABC-F family ATP-binding cassette domain-containing protein [Clostridium sp.]|nr:ABC-F family ATP-binding cassette domain-containing protein [Clostridium sp.]
MILSASHITKTFNGRAVLSDVSFHVEEHEKAAIVGINGAGKSTLLKIIIGELAPDEGLVTITRGKTLGYLAQHQEVSGDTTIYDTLMEVKLPILQLEQRIRDLELEMKSASGEELAQIMETYTRLNHEFELANGYAWQSEITGVLKGLGFAEEEFRKPVAELSGGQKTRVSLGKLLLIHPDIILLDEPTNHLDMHSIAWLETYLLNYSGTVIIVAHDRYFLDRIAGRVIELEGGHASTYMGNYTDYSAKKAIVRAGQIRAWLNQQAEIKHQEQVIEKLRSFNREKSIKRAESREKMLAKIQIIDKPSDIDDEMKFTFEPAITSGNDVLTVTGLGKQFDGEVLFSGISYEVKRGERVAIIGDNGTGKTTMLKIINGLLQPDEGEVRIGAKVHIGYYDQEQQNLDMDNTVFEEISDEYPEMNNTQIRSVLAAFLFTGEDVFKRIKDLSGGERGRVALAKLMLSEANFLILDEPTNHLDITSREVLENALNGYTGTVLCVSHDRYFINRTATRILDLTMGTVLNYIGNYDYYLEKKDVTEKAWLEARALTAASGAAGGLQNARSLPEGAAPSSAGQTSLQEQAAAAPEESGKLSWQQQKEAQARARKLQNDLKKTEEEIHRLETRDQEIDELLALEENYSDVEKLMKLNNEKQELTSRLEALYEQWEQLAEQSE